MLIHMDIIILNAALELLHHTGMRSSCVFLSC